MSWATVDLWDWLANCCLRPWATVCVPVRHKTVALDPSQQLYTVLLVLSTCNGDFSRQLQEVNSHITSILHNIIITWSPWLVRVLKNKDLFAYDDGFCYHEDGLDLCITLMLSYTTLWESRCFWSASSCSISLKWSRIILYMHL